MKIKILLISIILTVFLFSTITIAQWWTPYNPINLRCTYYIINTTNMTVCDNGTILFTNGGWIETTNNGDINLDADGTGITHVWDDLDVDGDFNVDGNFNLSGDLNQSCNNITDLYGMTGCGGMVRVYDDLRVYNNDVIIDTNQSYCLNGDTCTRNMTYNGTCINIYGATSTLEVC